MFLQIISSGLIIKVQHIIFTATLYNMNEKEIIGRKMKKKNQTTVAVTQNTNEKHLFKNKKIFIIMYKNFVCESIVDSRT